MSLRLEKIREACIYPPDLELQPGSFNVLLGKTLAGKAGLMRLTDQRENQWQKTCPAPSCCRPGRRGVYTEV